MSLRNLLLVTVTVCLFFAGCASDESLKVSDSANHESHLLPSKELTAVGMNFGQAKLAIDDLGFTWVLVNEDGVEFLPGPEVPGRFNLHVVEGIVTRQTVDGVKPYLNVNAMDTLEAQDVIVANGWTYRVTVVDGVRVIEDDSRVPGRYNLWVTTGGKVVFHEIDLVRLDEIWEPSVAD